MKQTKRSYSLKLLVAAFLASQIVLYTLMFIGRNFIPFNQNNYSDFYSKYFGSIKHTSIPQNFFENLTIYDAQWYSTLARNGYQRPTEYDIANPNLNPKILQFAFFPLFPAIIAFAHIIIPSVALSAFVITFMLQVLLFCSLYYIIRAIKNESLAIKTCVLVFSFPFSIFFRTYYTESLFLLLTIWFCFFTYKQRLLFASPFLGLLLVTRGNGFLLFPLFCIVLFRSYIQRTISVKKAIGAIFIASLPLIIWMWYCYSLTGNPIEFIWVKQYWLRTTFPFLRILYTIAAFPFLPFHEFHASKIEVFMIVVTGMCIYKSKKILPPLLWWISFCLWITPLLVHDTMSYSRYQVVNFPIFLYLASIMKKNVFLATIAICSILLVIVSMLFLNYYWIG